MGSWFDVPQRMSRIAAGYRQNRFAALQIIGGALAILIATAAQPSPGQPPSSAAGSGPETSGSLISSANSEDGSYGSTQPPSDRGLRLERFAQAGFFRILGK